MDGTIIMRFFRHMCRNLALTGTLKIVFPGCTADIGERHMYYSIEESMIPGKAGQAFTSHFWSGFLGAVAFELQPPRRAKGNFWSWNMQRSVSSGSFFIMPPRCLGTIHPWTYLEVNRKVRDQRQGHNRTHVSQKAENHLRFQRRSAPKGPVPAVTRWICVFDAVCVNV